MYSNVCCHVEHTPTLRSVEAEGILLTVSTEHVNLLIKAHIY